MKYFLYTSEKTDYFYENIKKYITDQYKNGDVVKVSFDDENYSDFIRASGLCMIIGEGCACAFGEDGYLYKLYSNHAEKYKKYPSDLPAKSIKRQFRYLKKALADQNYRNRVARKFGDHTIAKMGDGIFGFDRFVFVKGSDAVPFRFKKAKGDDRPLIIYFGGAGTIGHDNFKPLFEFWFSTRGYRFISENCNILIPQSMRLCNYATEGEIRDVYSETCIDIIKYLIRNYGIDHKRVYVYGTSFGGGMVWNILLNSPELFAAAVETVGEYLGSKKTDEIAFDSISSIPVWMAHSSDDKVVSVKSDDRFNDALTKVGANVIYTRWDKYGHGMCTKFYRKEKWLEWLLSNSK